MDNVLDTLFEVIQSRKTEPQEGSYTAYLFESGVDKILKKVGEECAETLIAAKNGDNAQTVEEMADLLYHLLVLMAAQDIPITDLWEVLRHRAEKVGNKKVMRVTDKNT